MKNPYTSKFSAMSFGAFGSNTNIDGQTGSSWQDSTDGRFLGGFPTCLTHSSITWLPANATCKSEKARTIVVNIVLNYE